MQSTENDDKTRSDLDTLLTVLPNDATFEAYYYSFEPTGIGIVDAILSAVAIAGKGSHHTEGWGGQYGTEDNPAYYGGRTGLVDGVSGVDLIQRNAERATETVRALLAALAAERDRADRAEARLEESWDAGVTTALNYAIRNEDGITLRLEHLDGTPWVNPYRSEATA